jgi:hypothetical protein
VNLVRRLERSPHGRNVNNNLQSGGKSVPKSPEVNDRYIEATASALDSAVGSADDGDAVDAIDNAFDGHVAFQVRVYFSEENLCLLNSVEDTAPWDLMTLRRLFGPKRKWLLWITSRRSSFKHVPCPGRINVEPPVDYFLVSRLE